MTNDLRERLEALKEDSEQTCLSECEREFRMELAIAFRSGDLVTRSEMEEAVAKAVAEEREACAALALDQQGAETVNGQFNEGFDIACARCCDMIRARSEQKEGE